MGRKLDNEKRGKLTITAENEIKQVSDKLRIEQH